MSGSVTHAIWCKSSAGGNVACNCGAAVLRTSLTEQEQAKAEPMSGEQMLRKWWIDLAREEVEKVVPKAIEYGATDLVEIGRHLLEAGVAVAPGWGTEAVGAIQAELGVYFYIVGKMARWADAVAHGRQVSDDTLHDIGVYVRMAQRIRAAGSWPGVDHEGIEGK